MERTQHPSNNRVIGAPAGWNQSELPCGALPVTDVNMDGIPGVASFWRPDAAELALLNAGGVVTLVVLGNGAHPVVCLSAAP